MSLNSINTLAIIHDSKNCFFMLVYLSDFRGKKITCPGARDKLNFRQDKHIFSPNVRQASKKLSASLFDNKFRTCYLATGQVKF